MSIAVNKNNVPAIPDTRLRIAGSAQPAASALTFDVVNPATRSRIASVSRGDAADVSLAVAAARLAFESGPWPALKAQDRARILLRAADLMELHAEKLALLETWDTGKPIKDSRDGDIPAAIQTLRHFAGWTDKLHGQTVPLDPAYLTYTLREPLGVLGLITPWNFPLLMAVQKSAPALAAGNTVVLKPAEQAPLTAFYLADLFAEAGLPAGVFNVVSGYGEEAGAALVSHPDVDGISFTGEYRTGQAIMKSASATLKRLSFELGGKSPLIVFGDADLNKAAAFACEGIFYNQGEVCCAGSRILVEEKIHDVFIEKLLKAAEKWQPGDPLDEKTRMGAIISGEQFNRVLGYVEAGEREGARLRLDGRECGRAGWFMGPTIFDLVKPSMTIAREEIFGPVLVLSTFREPEEAVRLGNQSLYGLAASVWTRDLEKAHRAARALKAGTVWINCYGNCDPALPFGGYKMSGFGREGGSGTFDFYTQLKTVWVSLP